MVLLQTQWQRRMRAWAEGTLTHDTGVADNHRRTGKERDQKQGSLVFCAQTSNDMFVPGRWIVRSETTKTGVQLLIHPFSLSIGLGVVAGGETAVDPQAENRTSRTGR